MEKHARCNRRRNLIILTCLGAAGTAVLAVTLFKVPIGSVFFFGMILLCPLMHLFMGHGAHGHSTDQAKQSGAKPVAKRDE